MLGTARLGQVRISRVIPFVNSRQAPPPPAAGAACQDRNGGSLFAFIVPREIPRALAGFFKNVLRIYGTVCR